MANHGHDNELLTALIACIERHNGHPFEVFGRLPAGTGRLQSRQGEAVFVKILPAADADRVQAEARGLALLQTCDALQVPEVLGTGEAAGKAFLVTEYLPLGGPADPAALGRGVAALHGIQGQRYGLDHDNYIGSTPQPNTPRDDWLSFWRDCRLGWQLELAQQRGASRRLRDGLQQLQAALPSLLTHQPAPALLHGDLWNGNWDFTVAGRPAIYDPAVYHGDPEADLAMMELFGNPGAEFFAAYREQRPLSADYPVRRTLYNLYHVLNHDHLFGGGFGQQAQAMVQALLAEVR